ncbi:MAG: cupin domain-containing protein [Gammaproteobacteria bacterium]
MDGYLIKRDAIESMQGLAKTHFLNHKAQRTNKSLGDLTGLTGFGFHIIEVPPGALSTECHVHQFEDEAVYVLEGSATARIGGEQFQINEGDFVGYRANGEPHTIENTGDVPLKCIVVGQRLAHDVVDYPDLGKRLFRNQGQPWSMVDVDRIEHPNAGRKV